MPSNDKPAKKKYGLGTRKPYDFKLPSGEVCLIRRLSMDDMIKIGALDRIDSLTSIVSNEHIVRATGTPQERAAAAQALAELDTTTEDGRKALLGIMRDKTKWEALNDFINGIVRAAVVEPFLTPEPDRLEFKDPDMLYASDVDLADRMAIMRESMAGMLAGVQAMEPFRAGSGEDVGSLPEGQGVQLPPLSADGSND